MRTLFVLAFSLTLLAESSAGIKWSAPKGWVNKGQAPMRAATYSAGDAECVVYFFGPGQGGSVQANLERWSGQFASAGKPAQPKVTKTVVHGLSVTRMDVSGTYTATGGAAMMQKAPEANSRMLAAIVEGPGGNLFVKFAGPAKTIAAQEAAFNALISSFAKQ
jgi:hypothetical protein